MKNFILAMLTIIVLTPTLQADEHHMTQVSMPKEFNQLKELVGTWEGSYDNKGKAETTTVSYRLTSGDTALLEELSPNTPHSMTTLYYAEGPQVAMTHFCMLGNHPKMQLKSAKKNQLYFEMTDSSGLQSPNEPHIHALTLKLDGKDKLTQEWVFYENGKQKEVSKFVFKRKK